MRDDNFTMNLSAIWVKNFNRSPVRVPGRIFMVLHRLRTIVAPDHNFQARRGKPAERYCIQRDAWMGIFARQFPAEKTPRRKRGVFLIVPCSGNVFRTCN